MDNNFIDLLIKMNEQGMMLKGYYKVKPLEILASNMEKSDFM